MRPEIQPTTSKVDYRKSLGYTIANVSPEAVALFLKEIRQLPDRTQQATTLRDVLTSMMPVGSGEISQLISDEKKKLIFQEYVRFALDKKEEDITLNFVITPKVGITSLMGIYADNKTGELRLAKIHVEVGGEVKTQQEYNGIQKLTDEGFPMLPVAEQGINAPLVVYDCPWDIEEIQRTNNLSTLSAKLNSGITDEEIAQVRAMNVAIGTATSSKVTMEPVDAAKNAPSNTLFTERLPLDGGRRFAEWYPDEKEIALPGIDSPLTWGQIKTASWIINGKDYVQSLDEIIENTRKSLSFVGEKQAFMTPSHGDDHPGNVLLDITKYNTKIALPWAPAYGGDNPTYAANAKALAHILTPLAGMYDVKAKDAWKYEYDPTGNEGKGTIKVTIDFELLSTQLGLKSRMELADQTIEARVEPLLDAIQEKGGDREKEIQRLKSALVTCALLTEEVPKYLNESIGRDVGLLPLAVMFGASDNLNPFKDFLKETTR